MNFIASITTLIYFLSFDSQTSNYRLALALNSLSIISYLIILIPLIIRIRKSRRKASISDHYSKFMALSTIAFPIYSIMNAFLSCICLYTLISKLFKWKDYDYLFITFSLVSSSLSTIVSYCKVRFDCVIIFTL